MAADPREPLGRIVHEQRIAFNAEKERPFVLLPWEDRDEGQRELDMRIGSAVAARAVADAGLENTRRDAQLFALRAHLPAILDALRVAVDPGGYRYQRKFYRAALEALGGGEKQDRSDEKEAGSLCPQQTSPAPLSTGRRPWSSPGLS